MGPVSVSNTSTPVDVSVSLAVPAVLPTGDLISLATSTAPSVVDSTLSQPSNSISQIVPSFDLFINLNLINLMTGVLFPLKPKSQVIKSSSVMAIRTSLLRSVETTFYKNLKNPMDIVVTNEHAPIKTLINILLSSILSATNLINMEESQLLWALVVNSCLLALIRRILFAFFKKGRR